MAIQTTKTRNLTHGSLTIKDGTGTPNTLIIPIDEGNLRFTVTDGAAIVMNRGNISHFTETPDVPMTVSFTIKFTEWLGKNGGSFSSAAPSPVDALRQKGNAAAWVSVETCGPYCVDLDFDMLSPCPSGATLDQAEQLIFESFHADTFEFNEGPEYNTLIVSGRCLAKEPTASRSGT